MNKKTVLTSLTAIMVAAPAMMVAVPVVMVSSPAMAVTWPSTDVMSKNTTYDSAATLAHMGVSENGANAEAQAYYNINSGYYLPQNSYQAVNCVESNYCPGIDNITKNSSEAQGIEMCPAQTFPSSDSGANGISDCYKTTCPTANQNLASGGTMSGKVYYGEQNNCSPSACASGFSSVVMNLDSQYRVSGTPVGSYAKKGTAYVNGAGVDSTTQAAPLFADFDSTAIATYPTWVVDFGANGYLFGGSACKAASDVRQVAEMSGTDGSNCYCWFTGYKPTTGLETYRTIRSVAVPMHNSLNSCATNCAEKCAAAIMNPSDSGVTNTSAVALMYEHASNDLKCVNTPYTITYSCGTDTTTGSVTPSAQVVEYLTTYTTAAGSCKRNGYTFSNWKVSDSNTTVAASTKVTGTGTSGGYPYASNKTYSANWGANTYTITLSNTTNGGSPANYDIKEVYATKWTNNSGTEITTVSIPTKDANVFLGYYNDTSGTTQMIPASGILPSGATKFSDTNTTNKATTVYAKFGACSCANGVGVASCSYNSVNSNACVYDVVCSFNNDSAYYGYARQTGDAATPGYTAECSACSNKPNAHAHYTGAVTAVEPTVPSNTCPWACDSGYSLTGKKGGTKTGSDNQSTVACQVIDDYLVTYKNVPATSGGGSCAGASYNSGTGDWTKTYTYGQEMTLCTPTKRGYSFSGWATVATGGTPQKPVTISTTDLGDKTYYAYWSQNTITIVWGGIYSNNGTYDLALADGTNMVRTNDMATNTAKSTVLYDGNIVTPANPLGSSEHQVAGQEFVGWKFLIPNSGS